MDLSGKKIFVAGANTEIGTFIVNRVNSLGAETLMVDEHNSKLKEKIPKLRSKNDDFYGFDIYKIEEISGHLSNIINKHGSFDGFVFCAGMGEVRPLTFAKYDSMLRMMNANCFSFVEMIRCLNKHSSIKEGGSIVAISSISSIKGFKSKLTYSMSKAALDASVRSLAAELSKKRIRVNSILKGPLTIDRDLSHIRDIVELGNDELGKKQLLGDTNPEEIASLVSFLLSDMVTSMTGTSLILDSGYTL